MGRKLDIGIASYGASAKLRRTIASIAKRSTTDWRLWVIDNPGPDPTVREVLRRMAETEPRIHPIHMDVNGGYAGAVNKLFELAETEYIAYCDNDIVIDADGWDETLCGYLDRFHEIGIIFPNGGPYPLDRGAYREVMWGIGFCWIVNRLALSEVGLFDAEIGHQEEADYCLRMRMAGYRCAAVPEVHVTHDASASSNPQSTERIANGVRRWVNKWNRYFNGKNYHYHHPCVTRWEDWPPNALYLEEFFRTKVPDLNAQPEQARIGGIDYDLIRVPRLRGFYTGRII